MKIIRFLGGLGNQMFQYALYRALQKRSIDVKADISLYKNYTLHNGLELEQIFDIKLNQATDWQVQLRDPSNTKWIVRKIRRILGLKNSYHEEKTPYAFDSSMLQGNEPGLYWGYWQNPTYFQEIEEEIKADFSFVKPLDRQNQEAMDRIRNSNSISIHIRRGDYLTDTLLGGVCETEYYLKAIQQMQALVSLPKYFVFSDDISWCKENLNLTDCEFISWNKGRSSYIDMQLMAQCKHNIIANSSFSWWAAWLNPHPNKIVICPKTWVSDPKLDTNGLILPGWNRL